MRFSSRSKVVLRPTALFMAGTSSWPVAASHSRAVPSSDAGQDALSFRSKVALETGPPLFMAGTSSWPVAASHSRAVPSSDPVRTRFSVPG